MAGTNKFQWEGLQFKEKYGRDPTYGERYLMHNQGVGGLDAHMKNPDQPAWQSMYSTGEGKQKGPGWSKLAIRLNVPGGAGQFGGVENITSQQFMDKWDSKFTGVEAQLHEPTGMPQQAEEREEHEMAGLPGEEIGEVDEGGKRIKGRGAADARKASLINEEVEDIEVPKPPPFQVPDLVPKFLS
jgi:hypothetical protein